MAKQLGIIQYSGKLGQTVGMKKSDVQRANSIRVRVNPSNPRTKAQAEQRMKINTALKIYRAAQPVLSRAFENKKYGNQSRLYFMSLLMSKNFEASGNWLPYVRKGDVRPIPGRIPVAIGSLAIDTSLNDWAATAPRFKMFNYDLESDSQTVGQAFQGLVDNNPGLQHGDQITCILCTVTESDGGVPVYRWLYDSLVVDVNSQTPLVGNEIGSTFYMMGERGLILFSQSCKPYASSNVCAGAIIVSRDKASQADMAGLRTSSILFVTEALESAMHGDAAKQDAITSYMNPATLNNNNWPYDAGITIIVTPETPAVVAYGNVEIAGYECLAAIAKLADGTGRGYKAANGRILAWDSGQNKFKIMHLNSMTADGLMATTETLELLTAASARTADTSIKDLQCTGYILIPDSELGEEDEVIERP